MSKSFFAEDLKNVKHKSRGRIHNKFNNKLQRRVYRDVPSKLSMLFGEIGVSFKKAAKPLLNTRVSAAVHVESFVNQTVKAGFINAPAGIL